jgi:hypothetical protein
MRKINIYFFQNQLKYKVQTIIYLTSKKLFVGELWYHWFDEMLPSLWYKFIVFSLQKHERKIWQKHLPSFQIISWSSINNVEIVFQVENLQNDNKFSKHRIIVYTAHGHGSSYNHDFAHYLTMYCAWNP